MLPIVKLISITPDAEKNIAYIARVSSPANQDNPDAAKLIKYCLRHGHYSVFEHSFMTVEVTLPLAIAVQVLRHRSFTFQQFSARYADVSLLNDTIPLFELRAQDTKNRQNSTDTISEDIKEKYLDKIEKHFTEAMQIYKDMLADGIAKECARFILPVAMPTKIYVSGNVRSFIHYISERTKNGVQKEHRDVALLIQQEFNKQFPIIATALGE
jgi:thymidylate synthase (FAD)